MKLTNQKIYNYTRQLSTFYIEGKIPVKINFFLQKNIQTLVAATEEIEAARIGIATEYGVISEDGSQYIIPPEKMSIAQQELNDLFNLEQDLNIHLFKLSDFDGIELTYNQISAIMFMIEE